MNRAGSLLRLVVMATEQRCGITARRALWFSGLLVLLAGIVGMHGLNSHAGGMAPDSHSIAMHQAVGEFSAAGHDVRDATDHALEAAAAGVVTAVSGGLSGAGPVMGGMCMAVLAVGLAMILRMLRSVPVVALVPVVGEPVRALASSGRDRDPPSLTGLSIRRC